MGINNTQMYESSVRTTAKHRVALDVLSYHVSAPPEDTQKLKVWQYFITLYESSMYNMYSLLQNAFITINFRDIFLGHKILTYSFVKWPRSKFWESGI